MEGPKFLDQKYKDLTGSHTVERAVVSTHVDAKREDEEKHYPERKFAPHTRDERIDAYLDRLDYVIKDERGWRRLKQKLMQEFTIDVSDEDTVLKIANGLYESEKRLAIEQGRGADITRLEHEDDILGKYKDAIHEKHDIQERTLSAWLDYLYENDAQYPTWFRYFVVRNLEKMGTLNKEKGEYSKRTDYTIAPFPELNSEALGFVYRMLTTGVGHQEFENAPEKREQLITLVEKKDFTKLYTFAQIETAGAQNREHIDGEWVKYEQSSDHHILEQALRGKGTGWCTAEGSAYAHLEHGDFYVYFTRGTKGAYSEPRIAIRMENDQIAEVRGVNHRQELEPALVDIAQEKYHALPGGEKFDKKSQDMKRMTALTQKQEKDEPFTNDDLRFLYEVDTEIEGFGYDPDPRIEELRKNRNWASDLSSVFKEFRIWNGSLELKNFFRVDSLTLPQTVNGNLVFVYLDAQNLILPELVRGDLDLSGLRVNNINNVTLPKTIQGDLVLNVSLFEALKEGIELRRLVKGTVCVTDVPEWKYQSFKDRYPECRIIKEFVETSEDA